MTFHKIYAQTEAIKASNRLWILLLEGAPVPTNEQFGRWHSLHNARTLVEAFQTTARKFHKSNSTMTLEHLIRYCSSVANHSKYKLTTQEKAHDKATA
jgi:hypothetical protein